MKRLFRVFEVDLFTGDFTNPVFTAQVDEDNSLVVPSLASDTQYKWRCKDVLESGTETGWSEVQFFTTSLEADTAPLLFYYVSSYDAELSTKAFEFTSAGTKILFTQPTGGYYVTRELETPYDVSTMITWPANTEYISIPNLLAGTRPKDDRVYTLTDTTVGEYEYGTADDISTLMLLRSVDISYLHVTNLRLSPDGTKLFILIHTDTYVMSSIAEYSLSTPWNISTMSLNSVTELSCIPGYIATGIVFSKLGSVVYITCGHSTRPIAVIHLVANYDTSDLSNCATELTELGGSEIYSIDFIADYEGIWAATTGEYYKFYHV